MAKMKKGKLRNLFNSAMFVGLSTIMAAGYSTTAEAQAKCYAPGLASCGQIATTTIAAEEAKAKQPVSYDILKSGIISAQKQAIHDFSNIRLEDRKSSIAERIRSAIPIIASIDDIFVATNPINGRSHSLFRLPDKVDELAGKVNDILGRVQFIEENLSQYNHRSHIAQVNNFNRELQQTQTFLRTQDFELPKAVLSQKDALYRAGMLEFDGFEQHPLANDILVVKLSKPVEESEYAYITEKGIVYGAINQYEFTDQVLAAYDDMNNILASRVSNIKRSSRFSLHGLAVSVFQGGQVGRFADKLEERAIKADRERQETFFNKIENGVKRNNNTKKPSTSTSRRAELMKELQRIGGVKKKPSSSLKK